MMDYFSLVEEFPELDERTHKQKTSHGNVSRKCCSSFPDVLGDCSSVRTGKTQNSVRGKNLKTQFQERFTLICSFPHFIHMKALWWVSVWRVCVLGLSLCAIFVQMYLSFRNKQQMHAKTKPSITFRIDDAKQNQQVHFHIWNHVTDTWLRILRLEGAS